MGIITPLTHGSYTFSSKEEFVPRILVGVLIMLVEHSIFVNTRSNKSMSFSPFTFFRWVPKVNVIELCCVEMVYKPEFDSCFLLQNKCCD